MEQNNLKPPFGAKHSRKRVGRGTGSGHGAYSGRGCKGDKSRAGSGPPIGYEGGQIPLIKRLPRKRGFTNIFKINYSIINVGKLNEFDAGTEISPKLMLDTGLISTLNKPVKVLGNGTVDRALVIKANKFSTSAEEKIVAAGGRIEAI